MKGLDFDVVGRGKSGEVAQGATVRFDPLRKWVRVNQLAGRPVSCSSSDEREEVTNDRGRIAATRG
jgi:hypothetical protein